MPALSGDRRRALELLARSDDGYTTMVLLAIGHTSKLIAELMGAGLATAKAERMLAGSRARDDSRFRCRSL
jgi:hypothetical protein